MPNTIGVLMGGRSAEREVSLKSGSAVVTALRERGFRVVPIDLGERPARQIEEAGIDFAFIALHGTHGEDGTIQGLLELLNIPYTGSGVLPSALGMNKITTKRLIESAGLPTPRWEVLDTTAGDADWLSGEGNRLSSVLGLPLVIKPPTQGSSIGVYIVHKAEDVPPAIARAMAHDPQILIEEFIQGVEVTAAILGNDHPQVLPLIEITSETGVYDYSAKYTPGQSSHIIPPLLDADIQAKIKELARQVYQLVGCSGFARVDFIVGPNGPSILEINTIPGMTAVSLYPDAARAAGISFPELCERLVTLGMEAHRRQQR